MCCRTILEAVVESEAGRDAGIHRVAGVARSSEIVLHLVATETGVERWDHLEAFLNNLDWLSWKEQLLPAPVAKEGGACSGESSAEERCECSRS